MIPNKCNADSRSTVWSREDILENSAQAGEGTKCEIGARLIILPMNMSRVLAVNHRTEEISKVGLIDAMTAMN